MWTGTVTQLIPPNYGIVDGDAFYVTAVVSGQLPNPGERVRCEAVPNTDGGQYAWRCTSVALEAPELGVPPAAGGGQTLYPRTASVVPPAAARSHQAAAQEAGRREGPSSYNSAPPPSLAYTSEAAVAAAQAALEAQAAASSGAGAGSGPSSKAKAMFRPPLQMSEEERQRSESLVQAQVPQYGVGAKLLAKMGFGATGAVGLGAAGQVGAAAASVARCHEVCCSKP